MFGQELKRLMRFTSRETDIVCRVTEHHYRPRPLRPYDQIPMHSGSQLIQAKVVADYLRDQRVVFLGDYDCMSLVIGVLAQEGIIESPKQMVVLDFDMRVLHFIQNRVNEYRLNEILEVHEPWYNVRYPIPNEYAGDFDVFYTNPPYGKWNNGESIKIFLGRCMELHRGGRCWGCAILPFQHNETWTRGVIGNVQNFLNTRGYFISEMLREMHQYALDDAPHLASSTVIMDRFVDRDPPYKGRALTDEDLLKFYGRKVRRVPDYIDFNGKPVYPKQPGGVPFTGQKPRRGKRGRQ